MATNPHNLKIGSPVWRFGTSDAPNVVHVVSETSRSWVLSDTQKVPKNYTKTVMDVSPAFGGMQRYCLTRDAVEVMRLERLRWDMAERVKTCTDADTLRAVAAALGISVGVKD